jgi:hypothetical protein
MTTSKPTPQPPAERQAAEAELRALIARFAPAHLRLINAVRRSLRKRLPSAYEVVYEYNGFFVISVSPTVNSSTSRPPPPSPARRSPH